MADGLGREQLSLARGTSQGRDRDAPRPLAADAPVGPERDHRLDSRLAPIGEPANLADRLQGPTAQVVVINRDKPLLGGPEDHRLLAPPAVRIAVYERLLVIEIGPMP